MRPFVFPFSQHIGAPSVPVVQPGDRVQRGQCIAEAGEGLGSPIYTSVSGMVLEVTGNAVIVRADDVQPKDYVPLTAQAPLECIRQAGIVGLGGAGFPTYQKLAVPFSHGGVVIANASECEPILNHNIDALEKDCRPMIRGLQMAMDLVHADKGVIAIKAIHGDAVRALHQAIADDDRLALHFFAQYLSCWGRTGRRPGSPGNAPRCRQPAVESRSRHHQCGNAPAHGRSRRC